MKSETTPEASTRGCKQLITTQYGTFYTPNYPDKYPRYSRCQYIVEKYSPDACEVKLTVHAFEVTRMTFTNCSEDYLEIQDGDKRYRICGDLPHGTKKFVSFPTDSNQLIFNFRSTFHQKKGFEIRVKQLPFSCRRGVTTTLATTRAPANCSRTLSGRQDDLRFPDGVDSTADRCTYTIRRSESRACLLQLDFSTFDVTESADCAQQYLMLPDGQKLCGVLGGNRKFIQFPPNEDEMVITSSGSNNSFNIHVSQLPGPCDVTSTSNFTERMHQHQCDQMFQSPSFVITSPGYPNYFGPNFRCTYTIFRPDPSICSLELDFEEFNLGKHNPASCDHGAYLELSGKNRLCHDIEGKMIVHASEFQDPIIFEFVSDSLTSGKGFRIEVKHVPNTCPGYGSHLPKTLPRCYQEVSFYSGYFSPSPMVASCELLVRRADPSVCMVRLQVTARNFLSVPCSYNYIELPDGIRMCISVTERRLAEFEEGYNFMILNYVNWHNPEFNLLVEQMPNSCRMQRSDLYTSMNRKWSWKIMPR
ncbi:cubilin [Trichonephila clavata]|uniref:Cubilin n=1 Tax=Trichonephila clavata TaxID=2740835 RepID=A0A8X6M4P4_TRICU|nr:cubilin [Trichonephila clavata]